MALILVIGAAYTAYQKNEEAKYPLDPEIQLDGKVAVELLPLEQTLAFLESPLTTVSFFDGNYKTASNYLQARVADIVQKNPWLGGRFLRKPGERSLKLFFDPSGEDLAPNIFQQFKPGEIVLSRDRHQDYSEYNDICQPATVKLSKDLVGRNEPIWRVSVIPDADSPDTRFALVMSMSHVGGDIFTFYRIYNMLYKGTAIHVMNPMRKLNFGEAVVERMGKQEANYIRNAVSTPLTRMISSSSDEDDPLITRHYFVSTSWIEEQIAKDSTESGREALVMTLSPTSVIASWFFRIAQATVGFIANNKRNLLETCDIDDLDAGNYQNPIPLTVVDYAAPLLVEQALRIGKRCGSTPPAPLPTFGYDCTYSFMVDWTQFFSYQLDLGDDSMRETLHLPIFNVPNIQQQTSKLSLLCLYTAHPKSASQPARMGAMIVAPQSMMQVIEESDFCNGIIVETSEIFTCQN